MLAAATATLLAWSGSMWGHSVPLNPGESRIGDAQGGAASADSEIVLDKRAQRRIGLRTQFAVIGSPGIDLPGRILAGQQTPIVLTSVQFGTIDAPPGGFPDSGSVVRAGQPLALLRPAMQEAERKGVEAELVRARRDVALGELQIKRYGLDLAQKFDVKLPTPSLQVVLDYRTAQARVAQYRNALSDVIPLKAPADGRLLRGFVRRHATVAQGQPLFELDVNRARIVEVASTDQGLDSRSAHEAADDYGHLWSITFLGEAFDPEQRLSRVYYALPKDDVELAVGEPVTVRVPLALADREHDWLLPADSVITEQGASVVWLHRGAEQFVAKTVTIKSVTSGWAQVTGALRDDDRVVVAGAAALQRHAHTQAVHS